MLTAKKTAVASDIDDCTLAILIAVVIQLQVRDL
jgi:hypothetical protein